MHVLAIASDPACVCMYILHICNVDFLTSQLLIGGVVQRLVRTDADIRQAVKAWCGDPVAAEAEYGHISQWHTQHVTDMSKLFDGERNFNADISGWDVSAVTDMSGIFCRASSFNQDLSGWDVSAVTNMYGMFRDAEGFNQDLSDWDVSVVTDMRGMFRGASSLVNRPSWY